MRSFRVLKLYFLNDLLFSKDAAQIFVKDDPINFVSTRSRNWVSKYNVT